MIKENVIYFGYGDILVTGINGHIILKEIEPPKEIGTTPCEGSYKLLQEVIIIVDYEVMKNINRVQNREIDMFIVKDYVLDFSNFNPKSVEVFKRHTEKAIRWELYLLAC